MSGFRAGLFLLGLGLSGSVQAASCDAFFDVYFGLGLSHAEIQSLNGELALFQEIRISVPYQDNAREIRRPSRQHAESLLHLTKAQGLSAGAVRDDLEYILKQMTIPSFDDAIRILTGSVSRKIRPRDFADQLSQFHRVLQVRRFYEQRGSLSNAAYVIEKPTFDQLFRTFDLWQKARTRATFGPDQDQFSRTVLETARRLGSKEFNDEASIERTLDHLESTLESKR